MCSADRGVQGSRAFGVLRSHRQEGSRSDPRPSALGMAVAPVPFPGLCSEASLFWTAKECELCLLREIANTDRKVFPGKCKKQTFFPLKYDFKR